MSWVYSIQNAIMTSPEGVVYNGYSGTGIGRDNPDAVSIHDVGPIPPGVYTIGVSFQDAVEGPLVMALSPSPDTETFGRTGFRIHGDNTKHDASHGCIILMKPARQKISDSLDKILRVVI